MENKDIIIKELTAKTKILQDEIRRYKAAKTEATQILKQIIESLEKTDNGWEVNQDKIDNAVTNASRLIKTNPDSRKVAVVRKNKLTGKDVDVFLDKIWQMRNDINDNPTMLIKAHRYKKRPKAGDIVKIYLEDKSATFGIVTGKTFEANTYSNGNVFINERLIVELTDKKHNIADVAYALDKKNLIIKAPKND